MANRFTFPTLQLGQVELVHSWLDAPHAVRWFDGPHTRAEVLDDFFGEGAVGVKAHVAHLDGVPCGLFQWEWFRDHPVLARTYGVDDPDAINCDVLLAPEASAKGLGATAVREFLRQVPFADPRVSVCVIDPVPENSIAIRCYEKAGFRFVRALPDDGEGNGLYLMELRRADLAAEPVLPSRLIRPGRIGDLSLASAIDDDACAAYAEIGLEVLLGPKHPYVAGEMARWRSAFDTGGLLFACEGGEPVGFAIVGLVDERPFLHQISVRRAMAGKGIGTMLLERAQRWSARPGELWLTTYDHVPWNRPWYERNGFVVAPEHECSATVRGYLAAEREALPRPEARVAMRWRPAR